MTEIGRLELKIIIDDTTDVLPGSCHVEAQTEKAKWHLFLMAHWILSKTAEEGGIIKSESAEFKLER